MQYNVYNNPEAYGLVAVGVADLSEPDYSFDLLAVWKGENGYYLGTDSGCSCPTPFEDYMGMEFLTGPLTAEQAKEEATSLWRTSNGGGYEPEEFNALMDKIS